MSRSGGMASAPAYRMSLAPGRSDGDPSGMTHSTNSISNLAMSMARDMMISCSAKKRPGHIEIPPPGFQHRVSLELNRRKYSMGDRRSNNEIGQAQGSYRMERNRSVCHASGTVAPFVRYRPRTWRRHK